jgi:uncharacterized repeat protein (TIGR03803 family)
MLRRQSFMNYSKGAIALLILLLVAVVAIQGADAQTYTVLHDFTDSPDGAIPGPIIRDAHGNLYGTTKYGGLADCGEGTCGTVYKVDSAGNYSVLYSFEGGTNGTNPVAGLVRDAAGNLYGTTQGNGFIDGDSVIFKVDANGQETTLLVADISGASSLDSPLALDAQGNLYGMSPFGGEPNCGWNSFGLGCGTLFKLSPSGAFSVLHVFDGTDGMQPEGGLVLDGKGNLYGTANFGGEHSCESAGYGYFEPGCGTVFKLDSRGKLTVLHTFGGAGDGSFPLGVIIDSAGNLYGIAQNGGDIVGDYIYGLGTVFKVDTSGNFSVLFTFTPATTLNAVYASHLLIDRQGNLYGLQQFNNCALHGGCLFKIDTAGNYTDLYDFEYQGEGSDGSTPMGIVFGSAEDVYGSMFTGGASNGGGDCSVGCGTVFHLAAK